MTVPVELINAMVVIFTLSLAAIWGLLAKLGPKGFLEWAIFFKTSSYLLVMLRSCAIIFVDLDRENVLGVILFALATLTTTWFGICAYATYWEVNRRPGLGKSWVERIAVRVKRG